MKRLTLASCAAVLLLAPVLALAQNRTPPAGSTTVGTAVPRGGESSTSSSSTASSASDRGGSSMGSSGMASSGSSPADMSTGRYDGPRSGDSIGVARPRNAGAAVGQPVPASERPRGDRPVYGYAVTRTSAKEAQAKVVPGSDYWWGYPYLGDYGYYGSYWGYDYGFYGYPYGWGYPFGWSYYDPYLWWTGLGPLYGWGMYALPMSRYSTYWYDYYYAAAGPSYIESSGGSIKLKVKPKDADVYVDGYFEGRVDNFDGVFQHLDLRGGTHHIEIRANGYQPIQFELRVLPGRTITYSGELKPAAVK